MIVTLYGDKDTVLRWWQQMPTSFKQWLLEWRVTELKELSTANEPRELYRAQGKHDVLNRLLGLEAELQKKGN